MSFTFDGILFDRIYDGILENIAGDKFLARLTQLSEASIESSTESTDAKDAQGVLIKRTYNSNTVTFNATNAMLDLNIIAQSNGTSKIVGTEDSKITSPCARYVKSNVGTVVLSATPVEGTLRVQALTNSGSIAPVTYTLAADADSAGENEFSFDSSSNTLTLPASLAKSDYPDALIKYEYDTADAIMIEKRANKFPTAGKFTLNALAYDPCEPDVLRHVYVVFPNFQISPDTTVNFAADATLDFSGEAGVDYCSSDKLQYYIVIAKDDVEE